MRNSQCQLLMSELMIKYNLLMNNLTVFLPTEISKNAVSKRIKKFSFSGFKSQGLKLILARKADLNLREIFILLRLLRRDKSMRFLSRYP